jgi:hypothetical protein
MRGLRFSQSVDEDYNHLVYIVVSGGKWLQTFRTSVVSRFLGALAKLQKATVSFVYPSPRERLGFHWTDFD